jgi:hypothetical protein
MEEEWNIINNFSDNSKYGESDSGENKENCELLDLELGLTKVKKPFNNSSKKRSRYIKNILDDNNFIKRKKIRHHQFNNIYPKISSKTLFKQRYCFLAIFITLVVMILFFFILNSIIKNKSEYNYYKNMSSSNTLSYNEWFYCKYLIKEKVKPLPEHCKF